MNWFQELSVSLHPAVFHCSQEVCVSERTWKTLWIYVILQAIRLSRALLNMTWSVPAPEQTLLSPWPARAVSSWSVSWDVTAVAFPKQISAAFGNAVRPRDLAPKKMRARAAAANAPANTLLSMCVCLFTGLLVSECVCLLIHVLFVFPSPHWALLSLCFLKLFSLLFTRGSSGSL